MNQILKNKKKLMNKKLIKIKIIITKIVRAMKTKNLQIMKINKKIYLLNNKIFNNKINKKNFYLIKQIQINI